MIALRWLRNVLVGFSIAVVAGLALPLIAAFLFEVNLGPAISASCLEIEAVAVQSPDNLYVATVKQSGGCYMSATSWTVTISDAQNAARSSTVFSAHGPTLVRAEWTGERELMVDYDPGMRGQTCEAHRLDQQWDDVRMWFHGWGCRLLSR